MASVAASGSARAAKTSLRVRMTAEARRWLPSLRHAAASCHHVGTAGHKPMLPTRPRPSPCRPSRGVVAAPRLWACAFDAGRVVGQSRAPR
jgi:hypothetical protein